MTWIETITTGVVGGFLAGLGALLAQWVGKKIYHKSKEHFKKVVKIDDL